MTISPVKSHPLRRALELISEDGKGVSRRLQAELGITRQAVHKQLQALIRQGLVETEGRTQARVLRLAVLKEDARSYERRSVQEDVVWREMFSGLLQDLPTNVQGIWNYGVTEMVNNAIDHSGSDRIQVGVRRDALKTDAWVADDGEGIFLKIQKALSLYDPRESILELSKGKFTTDPQRHSGEGIFFTSKVFDTFDIRSGHLHFMHEGAFEILGEHPRDAPGTLVVMRLANDSMRTTQEVFDRFAAPDAFTFAKTIVPVRLAQYEGETLVSRSQARRLYHRFEKFQQVILDFEGVAEIGQAFGDELFRVFTKTHPTVELTPIGMSEAVARMIERARAGAEVGEGS